MQLEAASDFELEESDTGSEVFAIDEEDVDQNAATALGPVARAGDDEDEDEEDPFAAASAGEMASAWDVESESASTATAGRAAPSPVLASTAPSADWPGWGVGVLGFTTVLMLFLAFVSMDLASNLYELRGEGIGSGLIKSIASMWGG
jgi:hypothetical protein